MAASSLSCGTWGLRRGMQDLLLRREGSRLRCAGFSLVVACGFSLSSCGAQGPECMGSVVSSTWALSLRHTGSLVEARELNSCGERVSLPRGMWDLSSLTRDRTHVPCIGRQILYHWTTREVPQFCFLMPNNKFNNTCKNKTAILFYHDPNT